MSVMKTEIIKTAITANLDVLLIHAAETLEALETAKSDMDRGEQNAAIGGLLNLERVLPEMSGLYAAILALHKNS